MLWHLSNSQYVDAQKVPALSDVTFYYSGTTDKVTVYKDPDYASPHAIPAKSDAIGRLPVVHMKPEGRKLRADIKTGDYKVRSIDGIDPGGVSLVEEAGTPPALPSQSKSGATVVLAAADFGTFIEVPTTTGAVVPVAFPRSTTVPNGNMIGIRNGGNGLLSLRPSTGDLIDGVKSVIVPAKTSMLVRSTGASLETFAQGQPQPTTWTVKTRGQKTPPSSSVAGDVYLAPDDASGWTATRLHVADGVNGFVSYTPRVGDRAIVIDETRQAGTGVDAVSLPLPLIWTGTTWVDESAFATGAANDAAAAKIVPVEARVTALETANTVSASTITFRNQVASGVSSLAAQGGTQPTAATWTRNVIETTIGSVTGVSLSSSVITLAKGKYNIQARRRVKGQINAVVGFRNTSGTTFLRGMPQVVDTNANAVVELQSSFEVTAATDTFELVFLLSGTVSALSLGDAAAIPSENEVYAEAVLTKLT